MKLGHVPFDQRPAVLTTHLDGEVVRAEVDEVGLARRTHGELPVDHGDGSVIGEEEIVEAVVAVHERGRLIDVSCDPFGNSPDELLTPPQTTRWK